MVNDFALLPLFYIWLVHVVCSHDLVFDVNTKEADGNYDVVITQQNHITLYKFVPNTDKLIGKVVDDDKVIWESDKIKCSEVNAVHNNDGVLVLKIAIEGSYLSHNNYVKKDGEEWKTICLSHYNDVVRELETGKTLDKIIEDLNIIV